MFQRAGQSQSPVGWEGGGEEHKYSAVMYETEDGKTTSKSSRLIKVEADIIRSDERKTFDSD